jgi:membrane fusion protein (multidrug efflux system)
MRDEAAFESLILRHGPMVFGVCRRVLANVHDAEDAFQATFLVLVRKAASIRRRKALGAWLYGVAYRTALEARGAMAKRRAKEAKVKTPAEAATPGKDDLREVLDRELAALPERYRVAVILCDLEGKERKEAARELGCPEGTVASRLARGRTLLAKRMARYGFTTGSVLVAVSQEASSACVSATLLSSTVRAALHMAGVGAAGAVSASVSSLVEKMVRIMLIAKLRTLTAVVLLVGVSGSGAGWFYYHRASATQPDAADGVARRAGEGDKSEREKLRQEMKLLQEDLRRAAERAAALEAKLEETGKNKEQPQREQQKIVVSSPQAKDVAITQPYGCQIHSHRHINVRALADGYLKEIFVKEGQAVKKGDVMFEILPTLYKAKYDAEAAEVRLAQIELDTKKKLFDRKIVSDQDVALGEAKLAKAKANAERAAAELSFTQVRAPFDGLVDRLHEQQGSLIRGDILTTLSDNSVMWVYFNVPEARYLEYKAGLGKDTEAPKIELVLANGSKFPHIGKLGAIEAKFDNKTGNIPFRADFPNPDGLLRHGQRGNVLIHRTLPNALVIPQRAVYEILEKRYVYVVGKDDVVHQREIVLEHELEDIFVIKKGLDVNDRIVLEGVRQVRDGEKVKYEFRKPEQRLRRRE